MLADWGCDYLQGALIGLRVARAAVGRGSAAAPTESR